MTLCANCQTHLIPSHNPDHPWRHEDTGFLQCGHGSELVWATPDVPKDAA